MNFGSFRIHQAATTAAAAANVIAAIYRAKIKSFAISHCAHT